MKAPQWLLRETVLALQGRLLAEFGGLSGLRDAGLLDSALARPQQLFAYGEPAACAGETDAAEGTDWAG